MSPIYRKTAKGIAEIQTRQHGLALRSRSALILVDGKRDADALRALLPQQGDAVLASLLEQGFIEPAGAPATRAGGADVATAGAAAAAPDLPQRRRAAARDVNDLLGPAGESLAIRIERAADADAMWQAVQAAARLIADLRGRAVAESFAQRHRP